MTSVVEIQRAIEGLSQDEMKEFRSSFAQWDWAEWERQIESDVAAGKLDALAAGVIDERGGPRSRHCLSNCGRCRSKGVWPYFLARSSRFSVPLVITLL